MTTQPFVDYEVEPQLSLVRSEIPEKLGELSMVHGEPEIVVPQQRVPESHADPAQGRLAHKNLLAVLQMVTKGYELPKQITQADGELFLDVTLGLIADTSIKSTVPMSEKAQAIKLFARGYTDQKVSRMMGGARTSLALQVSRFNTLGRLAKSEHEPRVVHGMLKEFVTVQTLAPKRERAARVEANPLVKMTQGIVDIESLTEDQQPQLQAFLKALISLRDSIWQQTARNKRTNPSNVYNLVLDGLRAKEIAERLGTSPVNVNNAVKGFLVTLEKYGYGQERLRAAWTQFSQDPTVPLQQLLPQPRIENPIRSTAKEYVSGEDSTKEKDSTAGMDLIKVYLIECGKIPLLTAEQEVDLAKQIEAGLYAAHLLRDGTSRSAAQNRDLQAIAEEGERAKRQFTEANLRLVVSWAKKYQGKGLDLLDLIQEGNLGLIRGIEKFDYQQGYKFSTYATWWIRQSLQRALADTGKTIRVPVHMQELVNKVVNTRSKLATELGRNPTLEEVAVRTKQSVEKVSNCLDIARDTISLNAQVGDDDAEFGDFIKDNAIGPDETAMNNVRDAEVRSVLDHLDDRERFIVEARLGFSGPIKTLDEVGKSIGLTRERVRQIERDALAKLRAVESISHLKEYAS